MRNFFPRLKKLKGRGSFFFFFLTLPSFAPMRLNSTTARRYFPSNNWPIIIVRDILVITRIKFIYRFTFFTMLFSYFFSKKKVFLFLIFLKRQKSARNSREFEFNRSRKMATPRQKSQTRKNPKLLREKGSFFYFFSGEKTRIINRSNEKSR